MWQVELQCPQCGGPLVLDETDRILSCTYCRARLFLAHRDLPGYYLAAPCRTADDLLYVPYRRFRGMSFSFTMEGPVQRVIDSNALALGGRTPFPASIGLRPQVLRLRPITPDMSGRFLKAGIRASTSSPHLSPENLSPGTSGIGVRSAPGETLCEILIGEVESLVYAPTFVRGNISYDAILKRPWKAGPESSLPLESSLGPPPCNIDFVPMICPHCGWDLQGERDALILLCRNCDAAWEASGSQWQTVRFSVVRDETEASIYLPFWVMDAKISGVRLESFADLVRLANLPKAVQDGWERRRISFWSPAFKVHPKLFMRLARLLTLSQPDLASGEEIPKADLLSATLSPVDAGEFIRAIIGSFATPRRTMIPMLSGIGVSVAEKTLVYLPFSLRGNEYVQPSLGIGVSKTSLDMGKFI